MGFEQNETNNIILDAVLTDVGRNFLARNDGSFNIVKFAAGDDEVDYSLIKKFGRVYGKMKIEQNTPIFQALTNQSFAQKYRLVSLSNENLTRLPKLKLEGEGVDTTGTIVSIGNTTQKRRTITISQDLQDGTFIDIELRDQGFIVQMDNRFLQVISSTGPDNVDRDQKATYLLSKDSGETSLGGSRLTLQIATKAIQENQFQVFGTRADKTLINTYIRVSGVQSGEVIEFQVQISKTS